MEQVEDTMESSLKALDYNEAKVHQTQTFYFTINKKIKYYML